MLTPFSLRAMCIIALSVVTGCQSASQWTPPASPTFQSYELTDDPAYTEAAREHWSLVVARCSNGGSDARAACSLDVVSRSLPDGATVTDYCRWNGGYIIESDCIIKMALTLDLRRLARDPDPTSILTGMPRDSYPFGPGRAADGFAATVWQECGNDARECHITEAAARLGLSAGVKAVCQRLERERATLRCLISHRLADVMKDATRRLLPS
ncbi:hypothetical protein [Dongia rigui]|uniref:Lipoprotein n=1 Tax=Dongia rigui TaxID=940149 RepID=A0ABU5E2P3_9PROT|nr:hypothetical protein [Dongia rigui]MDY0873872.1 hypothetical protein [Dongia rigui]